MSAPTLSLRKRKPARDNDIMHWREACNRAAFGALAPHLRIAHADFVSCDQANRLHDRFERTRTSRRRVISPSPFFGLRSDKSALRLLPTYWEGVFRVTTKGR